MRHLMTAALKRALHSFGLHRSRVWKHGRYEAILLDVSSTEQERAYRDRIMALYEDSAAQQAMLPPDGTWQYLAAPHRAVVLDGPEVVSTFTLEPVSIHLAEYGLVVAASRRKEGVGRVTMDFAEMVGRSLGYKTLRSSIYSDNLASKRLLVAKGWRTLEWMEKNLS